MENAPREITLNQALCRPDHLWGAERELVLSSALVVAMLLFLGWDMMLTVFGLLFWVLVYTALKMMAKADPLMSKVYLRHIRYQPYYRAFSTPFANVRKSYKGWS